MFVWEPVPPNENFIALGMVATQTEEPPPIRTVHCVPRAWVEPAPDLTKLVWSDAGSSGKPGSLWAVGSLQLLVAAQGNASPGGKSWKLVRTRFTLGEYVGGGGGEMAGVDMSSAVVGQSMAAVDVE